MNPTNVEERPGRADAGYKTTSSERAESVRLDILPHRRITPGEPTSFVTLSGITCQRTTELGS
jgi:hypothetical protein